MRALVLSGGGAKGAYQVGALRHLLGDRQEEYDILAGISVGAINCAYLAMYPCEMARESIAGLLKLWDEIDNAKVWKRWFPFGRLHAGLPHWLGGRPSGLNSAPLQQLVRSTLDTDRVLVSKRKLRVGAVALETGEYKVFDEKYKLLAEAVLASSSFPGMFLPIYLEGKLWTDGGVRDTTPLATAIEAGATEVDVVVTGPKQMPVVALPKNPNVIDLAPRIIDIMAEEIAHEDLDKARVYNLMVRAGVAPPGKKEIKLRVVAPTSVLENPLDFDPSKIKNMISRGYEDAKQQIE